MKLLILIEHFELKVLCVFFKGQAEATTNSMSTRHYVQSGFVNSTLSLLPWLSPQLGNWKKKPFSDSC